MPPKTNEELYEEAERALIGEAIAETETEIFDSAFDNAPDDNDGDTSLEEMDPDDVIDDDIDEDEGTEPEEQEEEEPEAESEPEQPPPQQERRGIPPGRLREEAEARRAAEAEARELRARIDALERAQRQPPQPPPQQPPQQQGPDMFADPEGWAAAERARMMQEFNNRRFNDSLADAAEQHGEKFQEAWKAINALAPGPESAAIAQRIYNAPNPGREVMKWHQQQSLMAEIGNDPAAYRDRMRQELLSDPDFRKEFMASLQQDARSGDGGRARTRVQLPPSLNGASGGTSHRGRDGASRDTARTSRSIEQEIFDAAWDDN